MLLVPSSMSFMVPEAESEQEEKETICSAFNRLCDEEPEHYVKRYITEPEYKAWFERNFPDYTFYEGIGITELEYQEIVNELTKPQPVSEQEATTVQETSDGGVVYVLVAAVAIGGGSAAVFFIKKGSKSPKTVQQESSSRKQKTGSLCGNCGKLLKPAAKFCGKCGNPQS